MSIGTHGFLGSLALAATLAPLPAAAQRDYDSSSREWNGLSELLEVARQEGLALEVPSRLDVGTLTPQDSVLIVYPTEELPVAGLTAFMRAGGRVALADDYGTGEALLRVYRIARIPGGAAEAPRLRGNQNLPIARPASLHALNDGVGALVTNHPTTLRHQELEALFEYDDSGRALVLAGAVGDGRLVALADPSVLINNMMQFGDNRRFAGLLLHYLAADRAGRILLVAGDTEVVGRFGEPGADRPFHDLQKWLRDIAGADVPPAALLVFAIVLAAILLVVGVSSLPRRSPYDGTSMFARKPSAGGFVGRVWFFERRPSDLLHPLLVYKYELEGEMVRQLGLSGRTLLRDVVAALKRVGLATADIEAARALLLSLDAYRDRQDHPSGPPRISARQLADMVATGERILAKLSAQPGAPAPWTARPNR